NHIWQGNWVVATGQVSGDIWQYVKQVSGNLSTLLEHVLDATFDRKQGDVNATYLNPLRLGTGQGSFARGDVAIYKGEDVRAFAPLPGVPSDWAKPQPGSSNKTVSTEVARASLALDQLKHNPGIERGIVLREVARLNTR